MWIAILLRVLFKRANVDCKFTSIDFFFHFLMRLEAYPEKAGYVL